MRACPSGSTLCTAPRLTLIGLLALAMGGQNAVVRRLAVPDLTTTVLTLTVTGLVADTTAPSVRGRRLISVLAMLAGALTGGVLLRWVALAAPLWLAAVFLVACAAGAYLAAGRHNRSRGGSPTMIIRTAQQPAQESLRSDVAATKRAAVGEKVS